MKGGRRRAATPHNPSFRVSDGSVRRDQRSSGHSTLCKPYELSGGPPSYSDDLHGDSPARVIRHRDIRTERRDDGDEVLLHDLQYRFHGRANA